jgi:crotonobetainyl-CoA:carnitine CoA-transferase CaiB-like acyl-CoA transferase
MEIINIIDRLDALVNTSRKVPGTRNRMVDADKTMELVAQLRLAIPQDVRAALEVIERKDAILGQAQFDAKRTKSAAEEEFKARLDQSDVMTAARSQADQMLDDANRKASRLVEQAEAESKNNRAEVDAYVVQALRSLEQELTSVLGTVRRGLDTVGATIRV